MSAAMTTAARAQLGHHPDPDLAGRLAAPFDPGEVKWKPQMVKNNRALAIAYIDARLVMDRLDDVVGPENWQDEYETLADGSVVCKLTLKIDGEWITKADVGSPSEQPDEGDRMKAAFSDALKRAAVKWGVGRYLYRLPHQWCDYDPVKKQFARPPALPAWAAPKSAAQPPAPAPRPATTASPARDGDAAGRVALTPADLRAKWAGATFNGGNHLARSVAWLDEQLEHAAPGYLRHHLSEQLWESMRWGEDADLARLTAADVAAAKAVVADYLARLAPPTTDAEPTRGAA